MTTTATTPTMLLEELEVTRVERLSPSFVRVEFGSPALADLGVEGPFYDQRIKLVFPNAAGRLPSFEGADDSWFETWLDIPEEERGAMRTYTIREVRGTGADTRLVVDFVVHADGEESGPGGDWGASAAVGQRVMTMAPLRGVEFGGIEFAPGTAKRLLLVADETAVPAVAAVLECLPRTARGAVFLEVPVADDVLELRAPDGVAVHWLPRDGAPRAEAIHAAVLEHLGEEPATPVLDGEVDPDLWETPTYSSSGEDVDRAVRVVGHDFDDLYAWIAGESSMVTGLRRALVKDLGIDRHQVAFMGYWRVGVSMRS
jgi:NADPH-dependent ferric siderophore reductase